MIMWWIVSSLWCLTKLFLLYGIPLIISILLILLYFADGDITLMFYERFGVKIDTLKNEVVWITGASSGIGEHIAYECAKAGCKLVLSARREDELERVKKQCLLTGSLKDEDVLVLPMDMLKTDEHKILTERVIHHFGKIDILVNNAGRSQRAWIKDTSFDVDRAMFDLNILAQISLTKAVLPHWIEMKKGHVLINSSVAGKVGLPFSADYTACKHSLHGYFEAMRQEVAEYNIEVTIACPGPTFSNFLQESFTDNTDKKWGQKCNPNDKRVATSRCAELMMLGVANRLGEVWISLHPFLLMTYMAQYMPDINRWINRKMGLKRMNKMRDSKRE